MRQFGLIGKKLGHSFSKKYFTAKFEKEGVADAAYDLYELPAIEAFPALLQQHPNLIGLNVTVPYKEAVIPFLDALDEAAARIGAVNTIKVQHGKTKGYNTDYIGFKDSLLEFCPVAEVKALVLGTGGASKAVCAALSDLEVPYLLISRNPEPGQLEYSAVTPELLQKYKLLINTTPLGMQPDTDTFPDLPYHALTPQHYLYDLVYNPEVTVFLEKGKQAGAQVINGLKMLYGQAEAAWALWNTEK